MDKLIGSILLITGTCIGAGMISLPVVIGIYGLLPSLLILSLVCVINIIIAFLLVETTLKFEPGSNLITMTGNTLGKYHQKAIWLSCVLFFYSILTAYTSGLQELLAYLVRDNLGASIPDWLITTIIVSLVASMVNIGTRFSEYVNRGLIITLVISFVGVLFLTIDNINISQFDFTYQSPLNALPIVYTSFGYLVILPYLRVYLDSDIKKIKIAIILGSMIPLVIYSIWTLVVLGLIPIDGVNGLKSIYDYGDPGTGIISAIKNITNNDQLSLLFKIFTFTSITSSFIGVSLALYNFLADGLDMDPRNNRALLMVYTFFPLIIFNLLVKKIVLLFLGLAGMFSVIISGFYPALMAWSARQKYPNTSIETKGGKCIVILALVFSFLVLGVELRNLLF